jgi:lysophospholipase L1-like esterase
MAVEIPGAMRAADQYASAMAAGNNLLTFGGLPNNSNWNAAKFRFAMLLNTPLTKAGMAAVMRYALFRGASLFAPAHSKQIVFVGDSLTRGQGASNATTTSYPPLVAGTLPTYDWQKMGVNGRRASEIDTVVSTLVGELAAQTNFTKRWAWLWAGTNDWALDANSAATILAHLSSICSQLKSAGFLVGLITMMDRTDRGTTQIRLDVNTGIRAYPGAGTCDAVYDAASEPHFSDPTNVTYFADGVHLTDTGYAIVATGVETAMTGLT